MAPRLQRKIRIQKRLRLLDHQRSPRLIEPLAPLGLALIGDRIGPIQRIIQAAPARICGIQRIARIAHRHDQLRPRDHRNLIIHIGRIHQKRRRVGQQIPNLPQKPLIRRRIMGFALMRHVPGVDFRLQLIALGEQRRIGRGKLFQQPRKPVPKSARLQPRPGERLIHQKLI